ncbi:hypothetical protein EYC84_006105 [Monilinia fructicola]|uniref:TauD/TfdA-like domain-containing protein n=1 Tax=Monilinia fructicola TaxID=38448 RepID=A0A5M9K4T8_MONFR|nr:hypothetical protein EYC84_006105 [Monilinia fructicola]
MAISATNDYATPSGYTSDNHTTSYNNAASNGGDASLFVVRVESRAALVTFSKGNIHNPFNQSKMQELEALVKRLDADDAVGCIVLTGGEGRSFSAGGDFHETSKFNGGDEVRAWIDNFTNLYTTVAGISKPVIAAIDGYAIGLGLQIALCCDYRIGSEECQLVMPELKVGIACNFGGFMLEAVVGRTVMQNMLFTSEKWNAQSSLRDGLLHEVVPSKNLVTRALERAQAIGSWQSTAVQGTRPHINSTFIKGVVAIGEEAKRAHCNNFAAGNAQVKMKQIITKSQKKGPSWILIANKPIPSLEKSLQKKKDSGVLIYGQGAALFSDAYSWLDDNAALRQFPEWATSIEVRGELVRLRTGVMNDPPLYVVRNPETNAWALGTDTFTLNCARSQWGLPVDFADPTSKDGDGWNFAIEQHNDPIQAGLNPQVNDFKEAGLTFVSSLQKAVSEMTEGVESVACLLSGGIDSGAVTAFAVRQGLKVTAYSAGSPWGNEHDEAAELTKYLGIPHVRVDFSAEDLYAAIPESIRGLGTAERDRVDILLTITAMMRSGIIKEQHILTGLGSDLLNLGLPPDSSETEALLRDIVDGIDIVRHTGEFTDFPACVAGKKMSHPYWHKDVVQTALNIHPTCKLHGGREKAFFRSAMEPYVPMSTAWRQKIGIHLGGGGLQGGLDDTFGGRTSKIEAYGKIFRDITARLLKDPFADIDDLAPKLSNTNGSALTNGGSARETLTPSGLGIVLDRAGDSSNLTELSKTIREGASTSGLILVRNLPLAEDDFKTLVRGIGNPVVHKFKTGGSDLMKLGATREKGNVVLGRGPLPLHTDGIFVGHRPDMVILYASEFSDELGSGETIIVDQLKALAEMPSDLRAELENKTFEYQIQEEGHYDLQGDTWFPIPPLRTHEGKLYLNFALQFPEGIPASWRVRVAGAEKPESDRLIARLEEFLLQPRYTYQHRWSVGDFICFDNSDTLHGRTSIGENGVRVLFRGQVNRPTEEVAA